MGTSHRRSLWERGKNSIESDKLNLLKQVAAGIAAQFGGSCEVVVHDLSRKSDHTIAAIENGHVTGRKVGDGASYVVMEQLTTNDPAPKDHLCYLTRTPDGKILKSSTIYIHNSKGKVSGILSIKPAHLQPEKIVNVNDLLEELIQQSVALVGKPVALMNKDDKVKAIRFLSENGAFLVTKSGDKIAKYFGISKYTLYSYIDSKQQEGK